MGKAAASDQQMNLALLLLITELGLLSESVTLILHNRRDL